MANLFKLRHFIGVFYFFYLPSYTIFIEPAIKGGAPPITEEDAAKEYSEDGCNGIGFLT
jgi:hypothetical protein